MRLQLATPVLRLVTIVLLLLAGCKPETIVVAPEAPRVSVMHPEQRELSDHEEFNGWMAADKTVEVRARVRGHIQKVNFTDGQYVKKGDLLFELDPRPFQAEIGKAQRQPEGVTKRKRRPPTRKKHDCDCWKPRAEPAFSKSKRPRPMRWRSAAQISAAQNEIASRGARSGIFADHGRHRRPRQQGRTDRGQPGQRRRQRSAAHDDRVGRSDSHLLQRRRAVDAALCEEHRRARAEASPICWRT